MGVSAKGFNSIGATQEYPRPADWVRAIWTRRWLILALFSVILLSAVLTASLIAPAYKAQALLEVLPGRQPNAPANPLTYVAADEVKLNTEAEKVGAEPVLRAVFKAWRAGRFGPTHADNSETRQLLARLRKWLAGRVAPLCSTRVLGGSMRSLCRSRPAGNEQEQEFRAFQSHLTVLPERETLLIKVVFTAPNPEVAANVVNAVITEYLNRHADQMEIQSGRYVSWLNGRIAALSSQAAKSDEAVAQYRGRTGLIEVGGTRPRSPTVAELEYALSESSNARAAMDAARVKLDTLRALRRDPSILTSAIEIVDSKLIQDLTLQKAKEEAEVAGLIATYRSNTPVLTRARSAIEAIQAQINQEISKLLDVTKRQYAVTVGVADRLSRRVSELTARIAQEDIERVTLEQLQRRANADSDLYAAYLRQAREAIEAVSWEPLAASVVAHAAPPVEATFPHSRLSLPLGIIGSAVAATIIGALIELKRQQRVFSSPLDLRSVTGVRVVGTVPKVRRPAAGPLRSDDFRASIESVAFRISGLTEDTLASPLGMRSALPGPGDTETSDKPIAVAVTSAVANEGKSVLTTSLAKEFRLEGARVLIIDADLRRPSIFGLLRTAKDCPVIMVNCATDGTVQWEGSEPAALHVLELAGMGPSRRVILTALPQLILTLKQRYDVLLVDTPPLLVASDALAAISACDRTLFAVKWSSTTRDAVEFALQELSEPDLARIGIVLTNAEGWSYMPSGAADARFYGPRSASKRALQELTVRQSGRAL